MACRYFYKGHEFNSEVALDDFLLENRKFEPILGDAVFSANKTAQNNTNALLTTIAKNSEELQQKYKEWQQEDKIAYVEDGEEAVDAPPYIGVNKFLSGLTNEEGELLFPEFREQNYWEGRFKKWKDGDFTNNNGQLNQSEIDEFGIDPNNPPKITDRKQAEDMRDRMKARWKAQAKTGTAIHNVLQLFFTKDKNGRYNFELSNSELIAVIDKDIEKKNKPYLNQKIIRETIEYARNLHKDLKNKFGDDLTFYPEFAISQDTNTTKPVTLFGIIDLLIVDGDGHAHVLDYKTSVHSYADFASTKKLAYSYQMAVYQRMLEKAGVNTFEGRLMVAPIQIKDFKRNGDTYTYDGISVPESFITIDTSFNSSKLWDNINEFLPVPFQISVSGEHISEEVSTWMARCFKHYNSMRMITENQVIAFLKRANKLTPNENGVYTFRKEGKEGVITSKSEAEFVKEVTKYIQSRPHYRLQLTGQVKSAIKDAIKNGINNADFPSPSDFRLDQDADSDWLRSTVSKYCNGLWEVYDCADAENYGIIILKTKDIPDVPSQVNILRISTNDLTQNFRDNLDKKDPLKSRKGLTGTWESDVQALSKNNNLMVEATNGNVELMETLAIIDHLSGLEGATIGEISVASPGYAKGMSMSNEELFYCYKELNKHEPIGNSKILSARYKLATKVELAFQEVQNILYAGENNDWRDEYRDLAGFKSCTPNYQQIINSRAEDQIQALQKLLAQFQTTDYLRRKTSKTYTRQEDLQKVPVALYNKILTAIASLKGINFRQQIKDHDKWLESVFIHRNGVSGSYIDNPGNLNSETLNLVTRLVTEAYQNTRDELQKKKIEVSKLVEEVKRDAHFGTIQEHTVGNQASLYMDMYEESADGNFLFKHPSQLTGAKRKLLEYALEEINKRRYPTEWESLRDNNDIKYYEVPLALGSSDSIVATQGLLSLLRAKLSYLNPKTAFERAQKKVRGLYDALYEGEEETDGKSQVLYRMSNMFDYGQGSKRLQKIQKEGIQNLEHNLETLLLKHMFAYSVQQNMDAVFPLIKAAMVHLTVEGAMQNKPFKDDIKYLEDYINNKILNKSIVNAKMQGWVNAANMIKQAASKMTLAFAPVQMFYQPLQGLWQDISLWIRKPDGKNSFTFQHLMKALKLVYGDFIHYSDKPTLCQLLNELYGINDMDMNTYIDRISSARKGFWNFENLLFKFASRPDFYNRMTIFTSQMMGDGCLKAHSVDSQGKLVYNWKLDDRFKAFANNDRSNMDEYNKAKSLYYTVARQFVEEHTRNADGTLFELNMDDPRPLPRAYTNKEAESMKSLGDNIYGYYSHEKKSMIMATGLGSLWLQFKTYWSGKKNQYLQAGGVKLQGSWKHYEENGQKYYYQVDANGNVYYDDPEHPPLTEDQMKEQNIPLIAPVYRWEGQWQEGIILTLSDMFKSMWNKKSVIAGFKDKWDVEDEKLQTAYRSNIKQFGYDLIMFALVGSIIGALLGDWLDELKNENRKNRDFTTGLGIAAANIAVMSVKNSFLDLNFIESVGSPIGQWTPFAFEWGSRTLSNWYKVAVGDEDFWDGVVKTSGGLKQIKPALDAIKPDMFRTEREGGTFNKKDK